jgi:hypothetical protein
MADAPARWASTQWNRPPPATTARLACRRGTPRRAPASGERSHVDGVEPEQRKQLGRVLLCSRVVTGYRQGGAVGGARGPWEGREVSIVDVVERLHDVRLGQMPLEQFAIGELPSFEFLDGAVARGPVVPGVDDRLADEGIPWNLPNGADRDRHDDSVPGGCRPRGSGHAGLRPQFVHEVGKRLRSP